MADRRIGSRGGWATATGALRRRHPFDLTQRLHRVVAYCMELNPVTATDLRGWVQTRTARLRSWHRT